MQSRRKPIFPVSPVYLVLIRLDKPRYLGLKCGKSEYMVSWFEIEQIGYICICNLAS